MNIVIFGPPGAGKGTQSNFIVKNFNLHQISTGELLREEIRNKSELGKKITLLINEGKLVSNEIVGNLIEQYISKEKFRDKLIFDGYPRNLSQANYLDILLKKFNQKINIVLKLNVSLNTVKKRILERRTLENRSDDNEDIAVKRYETYENNIKPVIDFYKRSNLLHIINGERAIDEISSEISDIINGIRG